MLDREWRPYEILQFYIVHTIAHTNSNDKNLYEQLYAGTKMEGANIFTEFDFSEFEFSKKWIHSKS